MPGKEGLLHVTEIDWKRIENVSDVLKEGDKVRIKLIGIDKQTGKFKLSRKVLIPKPEGYVESKSQRSSSPRSNNSNSNNRQRPSNNSQNRFSPMRNNSMRRDSDRF